jgi:hypothetical protein
MKTDKEKLQKLEAAVANVIAKASETEAAADVGSDLSPNRRQAVEALREARLSLERVLEEGSQEPEAEKPPASDSKPTEKVQIPGTPHNAGRETPTATPTKPNPTGGGTPLKK